MSIAKLVAPLVAMSLCGSAFAQGQDSEPWERDLQVIAAMLPGFYSNSNQAYFDRRVDRDVKHPAIEVNVAGRVGSRAFSVELERADGAPQRWTLELVPSRGSGEVRMRSGQNLHGASAAVTCELAWSRSAAEFVATAIDDCPRGSIERVVLSEQQLWIGINGPEGGEFQLHRARKFECYADIPGVGGGRAEPFDRYDGLKLHDQGGAVWFTSKEGRRLGISMLLVDWPINNFDNAFARDSLVVYLSEEADGERKELGYAFTVPDADRIGINLKWILVNCFMQSNEDVTPFM